MQKPCRVPVFSDLSFRSDVLARAPKTPPFRLKTEPLFVQLLRSSNLALLQREGNLIQKRVRRISRCSRRAIMIDLAVVLVAVTVQHVEAADKTGVNPLQEVNHHQSVRS